MLATLRNRNFALLWFGGLISMAGSWMLFIALPVYIYERTQSTLATGLMFMAGAVPRILFGSVAGVFVDRWERKQTLVIANAALTLLLLPLLLVDAFGWVWVVYVVSFIQASVGQLVGPAENSLLPKLVGEEYLVPANSLNALNNNLARLFGPALGGMVVGLAGLGGVIVVDAALYAAATAMIALITVTSRAPRNEEQGAAGGALLKVWREWRAGMRLIRRERPVATLIGVTAITAVGEGIMSTMIVVWVSQALMGGSLELGWLMSAQAIGGLLGGLVIGWIGRGIPPVLLLGVSSVIFGLIDLVIFNSPLFFPSLPFVLIMFVLVGVPASGAGTGLTTLFQTLVADEYRGRIFGAFGTTYSLLSLLGMGLSSWLGDLIGPIPLLNIQGGGYVLAGLLALWLLRPVARAAAGVRQQPVS